MALHYIELKAFAATKCTEVFPAINHCKLTQLIAREDVIVLYINETFDVFSLIKWLMPIVILETLLISFTSDYPSVCFPVVILLRSLLF
jgi:hypothetical protein